MIAIIYAGILMASLICSGIYLFLWKKLYDVNFTMIFTLVPIANLGYFMYYISDNLEEALFAIKITYIGGCFLQLFILFAILHQCQITILKWSKLILFSVCTLLYCGVLAIGYNDWFYKNYSFSMTDGIPVIAKEYSWMHALFFFVVFLLFFGGVSTIVYANFKKSKYLEPSYVC